MLERTRFFPKMPSFGVVNKGASIKELHDAFETGYPNAYAALHRSPAHFFIKKPCGTDKKGTCIKHEFGAKSYCIGPNGPLDENYFITKWIPMVEKCERSIRAGK